MAGKKATTPVVEEVKQEATETPVVEKAKQEKAKVYKFKSTNPYLTVGNLGIQFRDGVATTSNLEIAKALAKVGGVELVED